MHENEFFNEFYNKLSNIVTGCHNLGKVIPQDKAVNKILRSLTKDFHTKVTIIENHENLDTLKLQELVGNLQAFEFGLR